MTFYLLLLAEDAFNILHLHFKFHLLILNAFWCVSVIVADSFGGKNHFAMIAINIFLLQAEKLKKYQNINSVLRGTNYCHATPLLTEAGSRVSLKEGQVRQGELSLPSSGGYCTKSLNSWQNFHQRHPSTTNLRERERRLRQKEPAAD